MDSAKTGAAQTDSRGVWDSDVDFGGKPSAQLDGWEQLAQLLLCANEFVFVD